MKICSLTNGENCPWYAVIPHPIYITFVRVVLAPVIIYLHVLGHRDSAFVLYLVAAFSDVCDGFVARRFNLVTKFGHMLDQTADKFFNLAIFFYFFVWHHISGGAAPLAEMVPPITNNYPVLFGILVAVELVNMLSRWHWFETIRQFFSEKTTWIGKAKTWVMGISAGCLFWGAAGTVAVGQVLFQFSIVMALGSVIRRFRFVRDGR
jgi:phosphatidylglycerophosphate synthase